MVFLLDPSSHSQALTPAAFCDLLFQALPRLSALDPHSQTETGIPELRHQEPDHSGLVSATLHVHGAVRPAHSIDSYVLSSPQVFDGAQPTLLVLKLEPLAAVYRALCSTGLRAVLSMVREDIEDLAFSQGQPEAVVRQSGVDLLSTLHAHLRKRVSELEQQDGGEAAAAPQSSGPRASAATLGAMLRGLKAVEERTLYRRLLKQSTELLEELADVPRGGRG